MQDQIQEIFLEKRMAKQDRLEHREFATRLATIEAKMDNPSISSTSNPYTFHTNKTNQATCIKHLLKMEIPRFDGTDPLGWIFKITHFFNFHKTPEEQRISISSSYIDGPALN